MKFKKLISTISAAAMLIAAIPLFPKNSETSYAADTCVIDSRSQYQTIRGFGGINHPEWTGKDMTDQQRKTAFGNGDNELGLTVLRIFVNPDKNQWSKAVPTAQYATKMGVTIFASPWEPPANLAESGGNNGKLHLPKSNYGAYATHLNDFGNYMKNNNVNLYSISVQNEPDYAHDWTYWSTDETTDFLANYGDKITSTKVMSPESFQYAPENASWVADGGKKFYRKILNNAKAMANCDLFGTHFYGTQRAWMDFPDLEKCGKEIWMTEVYVPNSDADSANRYPEALQVSENIHNAMVVGNMSAYTWWYIRRSYGLMTEDGKISKRGYCMAQYSKWVRPGAKRIAATEQPAKDVYVSAYKNTDNKITVVAVNKSDTGYAQNFSIGSGETISNVDRYRTSSSENIAATKDLAHESNSFFAQLPASSVSTFVIDVNGGTPIKPTEPSKPDLDACGHYFHDTFENSLFDWQERGSAEILHSGRIGYKGTESLLSMNRTSSWHGAMKSLNSSTFVPGKKYSFSANVTYLDADNETDTFFMKLQYTGSDGQIHYNTIASGTGVKGKWLQLANTAYQIPADASDMYLYVETEKTTNNFYIDEAIGAPEGTKIDGAGQPQIPTTAPPTTVPPTQIPPTTAPPTTVPPTQTIPPTTAPPVINVIIGDATDDGVIDALDIVALRRHLIYGNLNEAGKKAADVDRNGKVEINDLILLQQYILEKITSFPNNGAA